jgi:hypothetical protein
MGEERSAKLSGGEPDITLRCVLGGADWTLRAHRLDQQTPKDDGPAAKRKGLGGGEGVTRCWASKFRGRQNY